MVHHQGHNQGALHPPMPSFPQTSPQNQCHIQQSPQAPQFMQYPLKGIPQPHAHDVLCGRGGQSNSHPGNSQWRMLVAANKELYVSLPKKQKMLLSQSIVNAVRSQTPPGRFLQKDAANDLWYDVGDKRAQEKTSQALREGAPEIRLKLQDQTTPSSPKDKAGATDEVASGDAKAAATAGHAAASSKSKTKQPAVAKAPALTKEKSAATTAPPKRHVSKEQMPPPALPPGVTPQIIIPPLIPPTPSSAAVSSSSSAMIPPQGPVSVASRGSTSDHSAMTIPRGIPFKPPSAQQQQQYHQQQQQQYQQQQQHQMQHPSMQQHQNLMPPPPSALDPSGEFSFGSMGLISDMEQARLMSGYSFGTGGRDFSASSCEPIPLHPSHGATAATTTTPQSASNNAQSSGQYTNDSSRPAQNNHAYGNNNIVNQAHYQYNHPTPQPVDGGLEPVGLSFGSMMSIGTAVGGGMGGGAAATAAPMDKLEGGVGLSFGSMMSYSVSGPPASQQPAQGHGRTGSYGGGIASAVDGGLTDIGTSFGSLSLKDGERERLIAQAEAEAIQTMQAASMPPEFSHKKSKGNLLDCSDSEDEDDVSREQSGYQKSVEWDKLKATLAAQEQAVHNVTSATMPSWPRPTDGNALNNFPGGTFNIPTTSMDRDFSQMSALSVAEDFTPNPVAFHNMNDQTQYGGQQQYKSAMPPPPAMKKQAPVDDLAGFDLEYTYLNRGNSLASDDFSDGKPYSK